MKTDVPTRLRAFADYSWRGHVPTFDDTRPLLVFDGVCVLCSRSMHFIARNDVDGSIQFTAAQSSLGRALFAHFDLDADTFETVLWLEHGRALGKRDAIAGIGRHLRRPWRIASMVGWLPRRVADAAYDRLAGSRYRLFGRTDICMRPDPSWAGRVIGS